MRIFESIGCRSGQCIYKQLAIALLTVDEIGDIHNHIELQNRVQELKNECRRLMNENDKIKCGDN